MCFIQKCIPVEITCLPALCFQLFSALIFDSYICFAGSKDRFSGTFGPWQRVQTLEATVEQATKDAENGSPAEDACLHRINFVYCMGTKWVVRRRHVISWGRVIHNDFLPNIQHDLTEPGAVGRVQYQHQSDESRFCTLSLFQVSVQDGFKRSNSVVLQALLQQLNSYLAHRRLITRHRLGIGGFESIGRPQVFFKGWKTALWSRYNAFQCVSHKLKYTNLFRSEALGCCAFLRLMALWRPIIRLILRRQWVRDMGWDWTESCDPICSLTVSHLSAGSWVWESLVFAKLYLNCAGS